MSRWHHGHSLATGALIGTLIFHAGVLWPLTLMFAFGLLVGRLWWRIALGLRWLTAQRFGGVVKGPVAHIRTGGTRPR